MDWWSQIRSQPPHVGLAHLQAEAQTPDPSCECTAPQIAVTRGPRAAGERSRSERTAPTAPARAGAQVPPGYAWGCHILGAKIEVVTIDHGLIFEW